MMSVRTAIGSIPTESDTPQFGQSYDRAFQVLCGWTARMGVNTTRSKSFLQLAQVPMPASGIDLSVASQSYRQAGAYCLEGHLASPPDESHDDPAAYAPSREPISAHPPKRADGLRLSS